MFLTFLSALQRLPPGKPADRALRLIAETLFVATLPHALAALVLGNFRFASFLERAHSVFQICECRLNHLIRRVATQFFAASSGILGKPTSNAGYSGALGCSFAVGYLAGRDRSDSK
jgi:hypothetical protein